MKYWVLVSGCLFFLLGCLQTVPLQDKTDAEVSGCQNCHLSPPPTGEHELHLFKQTHREQITCDECHGTSVRKMIWTKKIKETQQADYRGWQQLVELTDSLVVTVPREDTLSYKYCLTEVRGGTVYSAVMDSFATVQSVIPPEDSVFVAGELLLVFPFDSATIRIDTIVSPIFGTYFDTVQVNFYGLPVPYDGCDYQVKNDTLFNTSIGPKNNVELVLSAADVVLERPETNRIFVFTPNASLIDTTGFSLVAPGNSLLAQIIETERPAYTTPVSGNPYVLVAGSGNSYRLGGDTLFRLELDSSLSFGDNVFAELSGLHLNNQVDISFKNFDTTLYREDTIQVFRDSITGDITFAQISRTGSWMPEKLSCWSEGIKAFKCHDRATGVTQWYRPVEKLSGGPP